MIKLFIVILLDLIVVGSAVYGALYSNTLLLNLYGFFSLCIGVPVVTLSYIGVRFFYGLRKIAAAEPVLTRWYNLLVEVPLVVILAATGHFFLAFISWYLFVVTVLAKTVIANERLREKMKAKYCTGPTQGHIDVQ